jgi:hypothetical protein
MISVIYARLVIRYSVGSVSSTTKSALLASLPSPLYTKDQKGVLYLCFRVLFEASRSLKENAGHNNGWRLKVLENENLDYRNLVFLPLSSLSHQDRTRKGIIIAGPA